MSLKYFFCVEGKPRSRQAVKLGNFLEEEDEEKKEKKTPCLLNQRMEINRRAAGSLTMGVGSFRERNSKY